MHRSCREHTKRRVMDLDGIWDFAFLGDVDPDAMDIAGIVFNDRMAVPGCFDATPAYAGMRGLVAYRREIVFGDASLHRLVLAGVHHWCRVFVEGRPVGDHAGGFTRFHFDLRGHSPGVAELIVLVDNRLDYARAPLHHEVFDWYHYGGIARGAELHRLGDHHIDAVKVVTTSLSPPEITISLSALVEGGAMGLPLSLVVDGEVLVEELLEVSTSGAVVDRTLALPAAALWSPEAPNLHLLEVRLGEDDTRVRFGIRQVTTRGQQVLVNGEPVRLLGFNRHAAHPQLGHSVPEQVMLSDIQQLKELGCNFVRGSHYPQDARWLDLCDEVGIFVWSEAIGWQHHADHLTDPHFVDAQLTHIEEMVAADLNHPSIIMWGILNESHSHDPACRPGYERLLARIRELDHTRLVTYATNHPFDDLCLDLVDILSVNCYPGWYSCEIERIPEEIDRIVAALDQAHADTPLIISEIGAGAIYGWRDGHRARWSEQYQARLLETVIRCLFVDRDRACGLAIWQFCDCRTSEAVHKILGRPGGFNNKGVVDAFRRPKQAYETVKRAFAELR